MNRTWQRTRGIADGRVRRGVGALLGMLLVVSIASVTAASAADGPAKGDRRAVARERAAFVPGQLIVRFRDETSPGTRASVRAARGATLARTLPIPGAEVVKLPASLPVQAADQAFEQSPHVLYAEPDYHVYASAAPTDPRYAELWGLNNATDADIDAPEAWNITTGSTAVTVGVVDTGIAYNHPELSTQIWANPGESGALATNGLDDDANGKVDDFRGWDFIANDNNPLDFQGHGTHVAGTIGARANNAYGIAGVNWNVRLMPLRALDGNGSGSSSALASAFAYAGAKGAKVVNASLGGGGPQPQIVTDAVNGAPRTLFVVAAGNGGGDGVGDDNEVTPEWPCNIASANLICVAATGNTDSLTGFSNFGATSVDLAAPGASILSSLPAYATVFSEGFETSLASWTSGGVNNSWARATPAPTGSYRVSDSPAGDYLANTNSWLRTLNGINLSGRVGCRADYSLALDTESDYDFLYVEGARSATASTWTELNAHSGWTNDEYDAWSDDASAFDGASAAYLRFRLSSDYSVQYGGAELDNVRVRCLSSTFGASDFASWNGTSMATPHVAGVAALVWAKNPAATVAQVRSALLAGVDKKAGLTGKVASGGRLNAFNALNRFCGGLPLTIYGTSASDTITGTAGNDVIQAFGGNDTINGAGGDDRICGGDGNDTLKGGLGADTLDGGIGTDIGDYRAAMSGVSVNLTTAAASGGDGADRLYGVEALLGSPFADTLNGNGFNNVLRGYGGTDSLSGVAGNDTLAGGPGNDTLAGGTGTDTADYQTATAGVTVTLATIPGTASGGDGADPSLTEIESIAGSAYADTLTGSSSANTVSGLGGSDTLTGGLGVDALRGGDGDDTLYARDGVAETVDGGPGLLDRGQVDAGLDSVLAIESLLP